MQETINLIRLYSISNRTKKTRKLRKNRFCLNCLSWSVRYRSHCWNGVNALSRGFTLKNQTLLLCSNLFTSKTQNTQNVMLIYSCVWYGVEPVGELHLIDIVNFAYTLTHNSKRTYFLSLLAVYRLIPIVVYAFNTHCT